MTTTRICEAAVTRMTGGCLRPATIFVDGKGYCWQHDPAVAVAKAAKLKADREVRERKTQSAWDRKHLEHKAGMDSLSDEDLGRIVKAGGIRSILSNLD